MYNIEVPATIKQIIGVYHLLGIWRNKEESVYCKWTRWSIVIIVQLTFLPALAVGALQTGGMDDSILLAALVLQCSFLHAKMMYVLLRESEIRQFIHDLGVCTIQDREEFLLANRKLKRLVNFAQFFVGMSFIASFLLLSSPIVSNGKTLPLNINFPLNWKESEFMYLVAYLYCFLEMVLNSVSSLLSIIIWFLMMSCSIQYRDLGSQFRSCGLTTTTQQLRDTSEADKENSFSLDLIESIKNHRNLQEKVKRFKACFSNLFMAQILTSGAAICGSIFVLAFGTNENPNVTFFSMVALSYNTFDLFMVMYFGHEIKFESNRLSYCLFESTWIDEPKLKNVIILTEVLKQPQELIIYKLYPMNLETFTSILKFSYSMFNILKNFK